MKVWDYMHFNSIKVRLEHANLERSNNATQNFNSIKVRLERAQSVDDVKSGIHYFNSIKVRLEPSGDAS